MCLMPCGACICGIAYHVFASSDSKDKASMAASGRVLGCRGFIRNFLVNFVKTLRVGGVC